MILEQLVWINGVIDIESQMKTLQSIWIDMDNGWMKTKKKNQLR